jgi:hypothetical protein
LQAVVTGVADDQGDRDHVLGHRIAPSRCAAAVWVPKTLSQPLTWPLE